MNLKLTVKSTITDTSIGASVILWWITSLEVIWDEKGDLVTDCHSIFSRWRNHFSHCSMYMGLVMLGRQKYVQRNH